MVDVGMQDADDDSLDLHLVWTGHVDVLLQVLQALRQKELFADATLICGKKHFEVHQFVLSTCSLYLEKLFRTIPGAHPVLMFPDAPPRAMEQLLDFMYLGQTDLTSAELDQLLELAEDLKIIGLIHTSSNPDSQNQISSMPHYNKKEKIDVKNGRSAATVAKTPKKTTKLNSQISSGNQEDKKKKGVNKGKGAATVEKTPKNTRKKEISQDHEKTVSVNSIAAKKLQKSKDKPNSQVCKVCHQEFISTSLYKDHMKLHYENKLFSCPECPFRALSSTAMNRHINKHSVGKPYLCPYCQVRHPLEELHIAHQKRNHPKMKVVINKSAVSKLHESANTEHESGTDHYKKYAKQSSLTVQQPCTEDQAVSSKPPSNRINCDSPTLNFDEVSHERQESMIKTEISLQKNSAVKTDLLLQTLRRTRSELSALSSSDSFTIHTRPPVSSNNILKGGKKRKLSALGKEACSNLPSTKLSAPKSSTNPEDLDTTIIRRRSPRFHK